MINLYQNVDMMSKALDASWKRNEIISNNIANVNTPGYKKSSVEFESILQNVLNGSTLAGWQTHQRHLPIGAATIDDVQYEVRQHQSYSTRRDGNNVDIDVESAERVKNELLYQTLSARVNSSFQKLRTAITEGGK
ncbi:flagellar basal body rod protein FlgB [Anoxynatronum buryatiense]|uniref:Flagellar basal body rod protein FlgB n=1 Tax=Anoxynatronum buryatiense TaxID=489973 RepID=A0AA45WUL6_9CLOT|nr:flagellar basal body rod protein FlgB [Anoxynatronum buryatiense]SMP47157.1 flagellar basal-body rod protein FlgB [Anoxynatronum buryatiense]